MLQIYWRIEPRSSLNSTGRARRVIAGTAQGRAALGMSMWMFHQVGSKSSAGHVQIRDGVAQIVRRGKMTALQKPGGSVRGIVAVRTMSQQLGPVVEQATSPFQYATSTRAGCECIAHALQVVRGRS